MSKTSRAVSLVLAAMVGWVAARLFIPPPRVAHMAPRILFPGRIRVRVPMIVNARWALVSDRGSYCAPATGQWVRVPTWSAGPAEIVCAPPGAPVRLVVQGPAMDSRLIDPSLSFVPDEAKGEESK